MLILIIISIIRTVFAHYSAPHVKIEQGYLRGQYVQTFQGRIISSYTGIPYAEPPVGHLRFEAPRPVVGWHGFRNATELHAVCPQSNIFKADPNVIGNEDCLYLNVYTPQVTCCDLQNLPVMIFFHGGGFIVGDGNYADYGPNVLLDKDIVLVVPNYRLGPLGFLSTGDEVVPGNNGLKDQNLVIQWVKTNIFQFGGDPQRITLFGQSAGGVAAHLHMLSPLSKYLIKGVIAHSGTALAPWAIATCGQAERNFRRLAHTLNCFGETNTAVVDCLKFVNTVDLMRAHDALYQWSYHPLAAFRPVIEPNFQGAFITDDPKTILKSGSAADIPFIAGITTQDGATVSASLIGNPQLLEEFSHNLKELLPITLFYDEIPPHKKDITTKKLIEFYFGNRKIDSSSIVELTDLFTEGHFLISTNEAIRLHLENVHAPVYNYAFGYRSSVSFSSVDGDPVNNYGVSHSDDMLHLFPLQRTFPNYTRSYSDGIVAEIMTTLWTNFAATGNPTPNSVTPNRWEHVISKELEYLLINSVSDLSMRKALYRNRTEVWEHLPLPADCKI